MSSPPTRWATARSSSCAAFPVRPRLRSSISVAATVPSGFRSRLGFPGRAGSSSIAICSRSARAPTMPAASLSGTSRCGPASAIGTSLARSASTGSSATCRRGSASGPSATSSHRDRRSSRLAASFASWSSATCAKWSRRKPAACTSPGCGRSPWAGGTPSTRCRPAQPLSTRPRTSTPATRLPSRRCRAGPCAFRGRRTPPRIPSTGRGSRCSSRRCRASRPAESSPIAPDTERCRSPCGRGTPRRTWSRKIGISSPSPSPARTPGRRASLAKVYASSGASSPLRRWAPARPT